LPLKDEIYVGLISMALKKKDKRVIEAFLDRDSAEGLGLYTDGRSLYSLGLGGEKIAVWRGPRVAVTSSETTRRDQEVLRYLAKTGGTNLVSFPYERRSHPFSIKFEHSGDSGPDNQWDGLINAYVSGKKKPVGYLSWWTWKGKYGVNMVWVDPAYRRSGIATELYRELFKSQNIKKTDLEGSCQTPEGHAFRRSLKVARVLRAYLRK